MLWPRPTWPALSTPSSRRPSPLSLGRATSPRVSPRPTTGCSTRSGSRIPAASDSWTRCFRGCASSASRCGSRSEGLPRTSTRRRARSSTTSRSSSICRVRTSTKRPNRPPRSSPRAGRRPRSRSTRSSRRPAGHGRAARAVEAAGADGLSLVNTIRGLELEPATLRPRLARGVGGYSGPALKPVALAAVYAAFRATSLPIVGMGGVQTGRDAAEFLAAGASVIAVGTALFTDPGAPVRIRRELAETAASLGPAVRRTCAESRTNPASTPCRQH